jgi:hypothetical protein
MFSCKIQKSLKTHLSGRLRGAHIRVLNMSVVRSCRSVPLRQVHSAFSPKVVSLRSFSSSVGQWRDATGPGGPLNFFGQPRLPTNKGIMFVPQQEAWVYSIFVFRNHH